MDMYVAQEKFHGSIGNVKIGKIANVNLLCGDDDLGGRTDVIGSCTGCCESCKKGCYGRRSYRYTTVLQAHADNTKFARNNLNGYFDAMNEWIKNTNPKFFRYHSHGEILNENYFNKMLETAHLFPDTRFYVYTKRYELINNYLSKDVLPENLTVLFSPPFVCSTMESIDEWKKQNDKYNMPLFIYDDGKNESFKSVTHCPAVDKDGHKTEVTCDKCQRCIKGCTTAVYAH